MIKTFLKLVFFLLSWAILSLSTWCWRTSSYTQSASIHQSLWELFAFQSFVDCGRQWNEIFLTFTSKMWNCRIFIYNYHSIFMYVLFLKKTNYIYDALNKPKYWIFNTTSNSNTYTPSFNNTHTDNIVILVIHKDRRNGMGESIQLCNSIWMDATVECSCIFGRAYAQIVKWNVKISRECGCVFVHLVCLWNLQTKMKEWGNCQIHTHTHNETIAILARYLSTFRI